VIDQANWSEMKRGRWSVCGMVLFYGLGLPAGATSRQEDESVVHETRPIATRPNKSCESSFRFKEASCSMSNGSEGD
jgi:hypothetical protein